MRFEFNKHGVACSEVEPLLWDYSAGRASEQEAQQVSQHLESCEHCRIAAKDYSLTVGVVLGSKAVPDSRVTWSAIESQLATTQPPAIGVRFRWQAALMTGIAAVIMIVVLRGGVGRPNHGQTPTLTVRENSPSVKSNDAIKNSPDKGIVKYNQPATVKKPPVLVAEQHRIRRHKTNSLPVRIVKSDSRVKASDGKTRNNGSLADMDGGTRWTPAAAEYVMPDSTLTSSPMEATYVSGESVGNSTTEAQGW